MLTRSAPRQSDAESGAAHKRARVGLGGLVTSALSTTYAVASMPFSAAYYLCVSAMTGVRVYVCVCAHTHIRYRPHCSCSVNNAIAWRVSVDKRRAHGCSHVRVCSRYSAPRRLQLDIGLVRHQYALASLYAAQGQRQILLRNNEAAYESYRRILLLDLEGEVLSGTGT